MLEDNKLLFGIVFCVGGIALLYYNFKDFDYKNSDAWDKSMLFKGLVGGLSGLVIGVILLYKYFNNIIY